MGNGWHEWPLVLFTVLGQCVAGALIVSGYGWLTTKDDAVKQRIVRSMFFLWLVMGIAFLASVIHLGSPLRAFNSLNRIGASALSNEIASGSLFFAVGGLWWLVAFLGKMPAAIGKIWLLLSMLLGLVFVYAMTNVYQIDTVPTWYNGYTTLAFFMTMLLSGPLFAALLLRAAGCGCFLQPCQIRRYQRAGPAGDRGCCCAAGTVARRNPQFGTKRWRAGARLRKPAGLAHPPAGCGAGLLDMPACPSQRTARRRTGAGLSVRPRR